MALSGTITTNKYSKRYYTLSWTATQNVASNKSTIKWTITAKGGSGWYAERTVKAVINGKTVYSKTDRVERDPDEVVATGTLDIAHNTDGTKSFSASLQVAVYYSDVNCTASGSFTLNTIPRASKISATSAYVGNNSTITISKYVSSYTSTLTYTFGSLSGTIATKTAATSVAFPIPTTFYAQMPNATSKTGTITCTTYNGSTSVGTSTCSFTVNTKASDCHPVFNPIAYDTNEKTVNLTGNEQIIIPNYSIVYFDSGVEARNSATIKSSSIWCGKTSYTGDIGTFNPAEENRFYFTATDSRGYINTGFLTTNQTVNYVEPTIAIETKDINVDGSFTLDIKGNCFNGSFGEVANKVTVWYRLRESNDNTAEFISITPTFNNNSYTFSVGFTGLDYHLTYIVEAYISDSLTYTDTVSTTVSFLPVFDWGEDDFNINATLSMNDRVVLRENTEANNVVLSSNGGNIYFRPNGTDVQEGEMRLYSNGTLSINGSNMVDYVVAQGTSGNWSYRKWYSGKCEAWLNGYQSSQAMTYSNFVKDSASVIYRWIGRIALPSGLFTSIHSSQISGTLSYGWWNGSQTAPALALDSIEVILFTTITTYSSTKHPSAPSVYLVGEWK